jgi:hypothetical protein
MGDSVLRHRWIEERYQDLEILVCSPRSERTADCDGCGLRLAIHHARSLYPSLDVASAADLIVEAAQRVRRFRSAS